MSKHAVGPAVNSNRCHVQQQANAVEKICQPLVDQVKLCEKVAAAECAADGDVQGWEAEQ